MALPAYAMATLAELVTFGSFSGDAKLDKLEEALGRASLDVEAEGLGGRRGIYRGPVESYTGIVTAKAIADGPLIIAGAPASEGRTLVVRKTDADRSLTSGVLTVTQASPALAEAFDLMSGDELHGVKFFTGAVTASLDECAGQGGGDIIDIGTSPGYTELFSPNPYQCEIVPREWPLWYVAAIHEDFDRIFGADSLLVEGVDYELRNQSDVRRSIARLNAGRDGSWLSGSRVARGRLSAGWRGTAGVPRNVKSVVLELAAWYFQHEAARKFGLTSMTDAAGSRAFSGPPMLTEPMKARLGAEWRPETFPTADRAWVETI